MREPWKDPVRPFGQHPPGARRSGSHHAAEAHPRPREGGVPPVGAAGGPVHCEGRLDAPRCSSRRKSTKALSAGRI
jgi:hypothetical protein